MVFDFFKRLGRKKAPPSQAKAPSESPWQDVWAELARHDPSQALTEIADWDFRLRQKSYAIEYQHDALDWLDLAHHNGNRRERALRELPDAVPNAFCFALLLRRLNDWVPAVRVAAWKKLPLCAAASNDKYVIDMLFTILPHWLSWSRVDEAEREKALHFLLQDNVLQTFMHRIKTYSVGGMAKLLGQLGYLSTIDAYLHDLAKEAVQPAVRAKAYEALLAGKMRWFAGWQKMWIDKRYGEYREVVFLQERALCCDVDHAAVLAEAVCDKSPMVRRVAADAIMRELPNVSAASRRWAEILAADRVPSVAERGQFIVRKIE